MTHRPLRAVAASLTVALALVWATAMTAHAATETQDGVTVTLSTDRSAYQAGDNVTVNYEVANTNAVPVDDVMATVGLPAGLRTASGQTTTTLGTLAAGERRTETLTAVVTSNLPSTGGDAPAGMLFGAGACLAVGLILVARGRRGRWEPARALTVIIACLILAATILPSPRADAAPSAQSFTTSTPITLAGSPQTVTLTLTYAGAAAGNVPSPTPTPTPAPPSATPSPAPDQPAAEDNDLNDLEQLNPGGLTVAGGDLGGIGFIDGSYTSRTVASCLDAIASLSAVRTLLHLREPDPSAEFDCLDETSFARSTIYRLQQVYSDGTTRYPVYRNQVVVSVDPAGTTKTLTNGYVNFTPPDTTGLLTSAEAIDRLNTALAQSPDVVDAELLVLADPNAPATLAWRLATDTVDYFVDAHSGKLVDTEETTSFAGETATLTGRDEQGVDVTFTATDLGQDTQPRYQLSDPVRGIHIAALNAESDSAWRDTTIITADSFTPAEVSAMSNLATVYDFYATQLGRRSVDANGSPVQVYIHWLVDNAKWVRRAGPDPDRLVLGQGTRLGGTAGAQLDVVAHEYTHGVVQYTARFGTKHTGGALNEAYADILAIFAEGWATGAPDWEIGPGIRNLADPAATNRPSSMAQCGTDFACTTYDYASIIGHAAYLMATALGDQVGLATWSSIWYDSLLHLDAKADFGRVRATIESAARALLTPDQQEAVATAFDQTGIVIPPVAEATPTPTPDPVEPIHRLDFSAGYEIEWTIDQADLGVTSLNVVARDANVWMATARDNNQRQVLLGLSAATGREMWRHGFETSINTLTCSPDTMTSRAVCVVTESPGLATVLLIDLSTGHTTSRSFSEFGLPYIASLLQVRAMGESIVIDGLIDGMSNPPGRGLVVRLAPDLSAVLWTATFDAMPADFHRQGDGFRLNGTLLTHTTYNFQYAVDFTTGQIIDNPSAETTTSFFYMADARAWTYHGSGYPIIDLTPDGPTTRLTVTSGWVIPFGTAALPAQPAVAVRHLASGSDSLLAETHDDGHGYLVVDLYTKTSSVGVYGGFDGTHLVFITDEGTVVAADPATGETHWSIALPPVQHDCNPLGVCSTPVFTFLDEHTLLIVEQGAGERPDTDLTAINLDTGAVAWTLKNTAVPYMDVWPSGLWQVPAQPDQSLPASISDTGTLSKLVPPQAS